MTDGIGDEVLRSLYSTPSTLTFFAVILVIVFKYLHSQLRRDPKLVKFAETIPGPRALPIFGNGLDLFFAGTEILDWIKECQKKYGSIFRIWIGKHLVVFLSDAEDLEFVFRNSKMSGKPEVFKSFKEFWGEGLFTGSIFNDRIYSFVGTLKKFVDGPEFDALDHLPYLSFDIIAKTALGVDIDARDKENLKFHNSIRAAFDLSMRRMLQPWLHIKPICQLVLGRRIAKIKNKMLNCAEQMMAKIPFDQQQETNDQNSTSGSNIESSTVTPFMRATYRSQLLIGDKTLLRDEVTTILTAGTDTIAITNAFCLLAIAANPDIQDRLYDEIFEVYGDGDRPADADDVSRLPYLNQVMKETMRKYSLGSLIFRNVDEDSQIGARIFPAGTAVMIFTPAVHMNSKYYSNPEKFDPENFASEAVEKRPKLAFLNFGAGTRHCIGMNFGILQVKLTLIALLRAYKFRTTLKLEDLKLRMGFNIVSANGYKMSITLRDRRPSYMRDVEVYTET